MVLTPVVAQEKPGTPVSSTGGDGVVVSDLVRSHDHSQDHRPLHFMLVDAQKTMPWPSVVIDSLARKCDQGERSRFVFELASIRCALPPPSRFVSPVLVRPLRLSVTVHHLSTFNLLPFPFPFSLLLPNSFLTNSIRSFHQTPSPYLGLRFCLRFSSLIPFATLALASFVVLTICLASTPTPTPPPKYPTNVS